MHANHNLKDVFAWSSRFETGLRDVDQQHVNLVQLINTLSNMAAEGTTHEALIQTLDHLRTYANEHFQTEEALMRHYALNPDFIRAHISAHESLHEQIQIVSNMVGEDNTNASTAIGRLLPILSKWLLFHVLGTDMRMAHEIRALIDGASHERANELASQQQPESLSIVLDALNDITDNLTLRTTELQATNQKLRISETRYALAQRAAGIGSWEINPATRDVSWSEEVEPLFGFRLRDYNDPFESLMACVHPDDRDSLQAHIHSVCQEQSSLFAQFRVIWRDNSVHWITATGERITGQSELVPRIVGIMRDITDEKRSREKLQETNTQLMLSLNSVERHAADLSTLIDLNEGLQSCLTAHKAFEVVEFILNRLNLGSGGALAVTSGEADLKVVARWGDGGGLTPEFAKHECWSMRRGREHVMRHNADGPLCKHFDLTVRAPYICHPLKIFGETLGLLSVRTVPEVTEREWERITHLTTMVADSLKLALSNIKLRETLHEQAIRDPLTGLLNRRYLDETLPREIIRAQREQRALSLAMLDLDHFKNINDSWGHEAGDAVLAHVATLLKQHLRLSDLACRFGGEEFVIVMLGANLTEAHRRVEEIACCVRTQPTRLGQTILPVVTFSAGLAQAGLHGTTSEDLLRQADQALYTAKGAGRDCICEAPVRPAASDPA